jgi:4a-hydroxytetrahydrobiopterin dehydratase
MNEWNKNLDQNYLEKEFEFKSYLKNISFVNAVAFIANKLNHHPDLIVSYNKCIVKITTHDKNQITEKDYQLAAEIDKLLLE